MLIVETIIEKIKRNKSEKIESFKLFNETLTDEIFHALAELTHLKRLEIVGCNFTDIPDSISNLIRLHSLVLKENHLEKIPLVITKLTILQYLDVSGNLLVTMPNEFERLKDLVYLDISYNSFTSIPDVISKLQNIKKLDLNLSGNPFRDFSVFKKLKNLKKLYLNGNTIPLGKSFSEISFLKNLSYLHLDTNNFNEFPIQILDLINLKELNLSNNQISKLPAEINCLEQLHSIDLQNNNFQQFPVQLLNLPNLTRPLLSGNPYTLSELKFAYTLFEKIDFDSLNLEGLQFNSIHQTEGILYFKDMDNTILISTLLKNNYSDSNDFLAPFREFSFLIQVFGKDETKKSVLRKIRIRIDEWIEKERKEFVSQTGVDEKHNTEENEFVKRFFYYPLADKENSRPVIINFNRLLSYGKFGQNTYFINEYQKNIPVKDLLDYIGVDEKEIKNLKTNKEWRGKSFLTGIIIDNFKIFSHLVFDLSEHFNIILGRNGLGKTSILQAITLGLIPLDSLDKPSFFEDYIQYPKYVSEVYLSWGEENKRTYIFKNEIKAEEYVNFPQKLILAYGVNLNTNPELDHSEIVNKILIGDALPYSTKSIFSDYSTNFHDPLIILEKLIIERDDTNSNTIDNIIQLIGNTLNHYLELIEDSGGIYLEGKNTDFYSNGKIKRRTTRVKTARRKVINSAGLVIKEANFYFTDINVNRLKTNQLSEGYRDHILLVTDILIRILASRNEIFGKENVEITPQFFKEVNGVILIDEFDRHLHPVWQRKLLSRFKEDFPKIQFILTTHNPFSVQSAVGANAIELVVEDKTIKTVNNTIESRNILSIIREYFTKDFFDYETQEQMKQFSKYLDEIDEGNTDLAYSQEFKNLVVSISEKSDELKSIIGSQLLQLNATLKKLNHKEFEL
jgi:Leucine-rich repeat (LRR) protein/AAA15 family ATPase/GTPase